MPPELPEDDDEDEDDDDDDEDAKEAATLPLAPDAGHSRGYLKK